MPREKRGAATLREIVEQFRRDMEKTGLGVSIKAGDGPWIKISSSRKHDHPMRWTKDLAFTHLRLMHDRYFHAVPDLEELLQVHRVLHERTEGK